MPSSRSLYDVLNVSPEAEGVVIDAAYKALMKRYHPDHAEDAGRARDAAEINHAFAVLKDPEQRAAYDKKLWSKQQAVRLAELKALDAPPPRRGSRLFAWGGWVIAAGIGCAFAAMAVERTIAKSVPVAAIQAAQKSQDKARGAQKAPLSAAALAKKVAADIEAVAPPQSSASVLAAVRAQAGVPARPAAAIAAPVVRNEPRRYRPAAASAPEPVRQRRAPSPRKSRGEKRDNPDFLEREGYIY